MHSIAYLFRRKPGLSVEEFRDIYKTHRNVMLNYSTGLVNYTQHLVRDKHPVGDIYTPDIQDVFDAISIYTYDTAENARLSSLAPEIIEDSMRFIDFDTMISLPVDSVKVR